jgi:signal transduction histidine kinase
MQFWQKSLRIRLITYFFLLSLIPITLVGLVAFFLARSVLEQSVFDQLNANTSAKEEELNRWVTDRTQDVYFLSRSPAIWQPIDRIVNQENMTTEELALAQSELSRYLGEVLVRRSDMAEIFVVSLDGSILFSTDEAHVGLQQQSMPYFIEGQMVTFVQKVYNSEMLGRPTMTIASPLLNERSRRIGVIAAHLDLELLDAVILDEAGLAGGSQTYLVNSSYRFLITADPTTDLTTEVHTEGIDRAVNGTDGSGRYTNHESIPVLGAYRWIDNLEMAILAEIPEIVAFQPANQLGFTIFSIAAILAFLAIAAASFWTRQITEPILSVTNSAVQIASGDLGATATVFTDDEIGMLARSFNQMTERLRRLLHSLEAQVTARTAELAQRVEQLNLINQVGRNANSFIELNPLLATVAGLIRQTFDYYVVIVALIDEDAGELYIPAGDSAEDIDLLARNVRLSLTQSSIMAHVARTGEPLVVSDVSQESRYLYLDELPYTRSELALPLIVGEKVLGVLDLQDKSANAFSPNDVQVLQTLAAQIAVAIQNAALFDTAQEARAEAEEANRLKTQFLTNMSHELRTPLNAVINFAYLLSVGIEGTLEPNQKDLVDRIGVAGEHLLNLINDILDLAKIESGRVAMYLEDFAIGELVKGVMSTAVGLVRGKSIELKQEIPGDLPLVRADRGRIRQVLLNLVANAAKFTKTGLISVWATADDNWVTIHVSDTGIGIAPEDMDKVFTAFLQVDGDLTRQVGGTGLGLPISKQFVEMHGGQMWLESDVGIGSTFSFTLPRADAEPDFNEYNDLVGFEEEANG